MIPIRVRVQGFLSYRDEAVLEFDGAALWMLTGPNGAGKSAVFDAVTFALYGAHRGGKQNADKLINQHCDKLVAEFDFRLDEDVYRAKRTESRRGQPTRQIIHLSGPNAPQRRRSGEAVVPETDSKAGFDAWVKEHIGLSYEAFKASMLLRQGDSDALLKMDSRERHDVLTQLVDLSDYVNLYERAKAKHNEHSAKEKLLANQLEQLPAVSPEAIDVLATTANDNREISAQAQAELQKIAALKTHAEHWQQLMIRHAQAEGDLKKSQSLIVRADEVERAAQRLAELSVVLPILERLRDARQKGTQARSEISKLQEHLEALSRDMGVAKSERDTFQQSLESLRKEQKDTNSSMHKAQAELVQLTPAQQDLGRLTELQIEVAQIDRELAVFPDDLDAQAEQAQQALEHLMEVKAMLADLRQIQAGQKERAEALDEAERWDTKRAKLEEQVQELEAQLSVSRTEEEAAGQALTRAEQELTRAKAEVDAMQERQGKLESLEGKATCTYCGQLLTPKHLKEERNRLRRALTDAQLAVKNAQDASDSAKRYSAQAAQAVRKLEKRIQAIKEDIVQARQGAQERRRAAQDARQRIQAALSKLPTEVRPRIKDSYPSESDLQALEAEAGKLKSIRERQARLTQKVQARNQLAAGRAPLAGERDRLAAAYPDERANAVRVQIREAEAMVRNLRDRLQTLASQIEPMDIHWRAVEQRVQDVQAQIAACQQAKAVAAEQQIHAEADEAQSLDQLPEIWHTTAADLTGESWQALREEQDQLRGADQRLTALQEARQTETQARRDVERLRAELEGIPAEAQHELDYFERLAQQAMSCQQEADEAARRADAKRIALEARMTERAQIERDNLEAARLAQRYKTLADLLGRDGLQRHLLEQVERAIVSNANAVLDRISGGTLWLELQGDAGASKTKALDMVAYDRANDANAIAVDYLSGSQRFRTAVSLALGIGQYASQDSHRVEAVIIDEGFGSLDKTGRQEMIDELHNLRDTLSRIILVSHQDEFARAFPNRYAIRIHDGSSIAGLETGEE
jgi:DNA repair exonuclease SbcCD ATPase subunit